MFTERVSTLPDQPVKREHGFAMRFRTAERKAIEILANYLHLPTLSLAPYLLLQGVKYHIKHEMIEEVAGATDQASM